MLLLQLCPSTLTEARLHNMTIGRIPSVEGGIQPTIVDAKGDLIAATAADTVNRLAVGSNDQVLVADSAASTGLAWKSYGSQLSSSNPVLNSSFDIWQRGTSQSVTSSSTSFYGPDRWQIYRAATGSTVSRQATGDTTNLPNIQYSMRLQRDSGNTSTSNINAFNNFETVNSIPFSGKTVTLSFYARRGANFSATSNILTGWLRSGTGTDQNYASAYTGANTVTFTDATLTTTWQRFTCSGTIPTNATELAIQFQFTPTGTAGADDWAEITGVQIDVGSVATPFRRNSGTIQGELAACQRYYFRQTAAGITEPYAQGFAYNTTGGYAVVAIPSNMRVKPTAIEVSNVQISDWINNIATTVTIGFCVSNNVWLSFTGSGYTSNRPYVLNASSATSHLGFSAEL
jgi:hypothetical protein